MVPGSWFANMTISIEGSKVTTEAFDLQVSTIITCCRSLIMTPKCVREAAPKIEYNLADNELQYLPYTRCMVKVDPKSTYCSLLQQTCNLIDRSIGMSRGYDFN